MNPTTPLPLRDIHLPEPISWWPPALGWWLLVVLAPLTLWLLVKLYRRITRKTALKSAKKLLIALKHDTELDDYDKVCHLSVLLRRVAISLAPRSEAAGLTGAAWLAYLDRSLPGQPFSEGIGRHLVETPYRNKEAVQVDVPELITLCEHWLKAQAKRKR